LEWIGLRGQSGWTNFEGGWQGPAEQVLRRWKTAN
jgi:hypothetical protein